MLAADTGDAWSIEAHEGRLQPRRDAPDAAAEGAGCTVSGPASGLYLYLWNRADAARAGVTVTGDPGLLRPGRPASASAGADRLALDCQTRVLASNTCSI